MYSYRNLVDMKTLRGISTVSWGSWPLNLSIASHVCITHLCQQKHSPLSSHSLLDTDTGDGNTHPRKRLPALIEHHTQRVKYSRIIYQQPRRGRMSDEPHSRFSKNTMITYGITKYTSQIRLIHVAFAREIFDRDARAVEGHPFGNVVTVDGLEAGGVDLILLLVRGGVMLVLRN